MATRTEMVFLGLILIIIGASTGLLNPDPEIVGESLQFVNAPVIGDITIGMLLLVMVFIAVVVELNKK